MTKTKVPTYVVTAWFDVRFDYVGHDWPRTTTPEGQEVVQYLLGGCTLTTDDVHRQLDRHAREQHARWEADGTPYTGLIGLGDGWWKTPGAEMRYRVEEK